MSVQPVATDSSIRSRRLGGPITSWLGFGRRLIGRPEGLVGVAIIAVFTILAIAPALFVGPLESVTTATGGRLEPPSAEHLLGTDNLGRDVLNLTVHGARISLLIGFMATLVTIVIGALLGIVSGFVGGPVDSAIMRVTDFFLVLPTFVLALIIAPIVLDIIGTGEILGFRSTLFVIIVVIGITSWATTARIIRSQTLSVKERAFVDRARVIGAGPWHTMRVHILPNVTGLIVANAVLIFAGAILTETTLAFIGLGDPFAPSWGQVLGASQDAGAPGLGAWWWYVSPGVCIVLVVLAFTLIGGALDDLLNPKARRRR